MAFWGPDSSLPIELRVAAVLADERLELREDGERARKDVAYRKGTIAPANTLESLDRGVPALRTWMAGFHRTERPDRAEKGSLGLPRTRFGLGLLQTGRKLLRNFATFGATTTRQYPAVGFLRK